VTPIEKLEKIRDYLTDKSVDLSLFGDDRKMNIKSLIECFDKIANTLNEVIKEISA